jgi:antitoxin component YwqK of YwqJK toxin-antitoxin module
MRKLLLCCFLLLFIAKLFAQETINRRINFNPIDRDSLNLSLNDQFMLIEDSCAAVTRHIRFDFDSRKFHGRFTDVRKDNPAVILTEGYYNADGKKEGTFTIRYTSGNIKAKGDFKNDDFDGKWEMYYDSGKPMITFEANNGVYTITDAWDDKGSKTVDRGNGNYAVEIAQQYTWEGKLVNGKPDGAWKMYRSADKYKNTLGSEHFKKGEFTRGENQFGPYSNASRISLVNKDLFPFTNAEKLLIGLPCNMASIKHNLLNAHYKNGMNSFNNRLRDALTSFFNYKDLSASYGEFNIVGEINTEGDIVNLKREGGSSLEAIAGGIINIISGLPRLIPVIVDDKPVTEGFKLQLNLSRGSYSYNFQFLPVSYRKQ